MERGWIYQETGTGTDKKFFKSKGDIKYLNWEFFSQSELRIVPLGSSISLTVRQRGKAINSLFFLGGSSSVLAVLATILQSVSVI